MTRIQGWVTLSVFNYIDVKRLPFKSQTPLKIAAAYLKSCVGEIGYLHDDNVLDAWTAIPFKAMAT